MQLVFDRIAKWNDARYEQEFNLTLTLKLLREEHREWLEAKGRVDQVHELCDVIYVALGAMWKLKEEMNPHMAQACIDHVNEAAELFRTPGVLCSAAIDMMEITPEAEAKQVQNFLGNLFAISMYAQAQLLDYGLSFDQIVECMLVLCDSNDSKSIKKTASNVKANSNDKGSYYKSPIPGLTRILENVHVH